MHEFELIVQALGVPASEFIKPKKNRKKTSTAKTMCLKKINEVSPNLRSANAVTV